MTLDTGTAKPDVTVNLSADASDPDYEIYVHSVRYSQQDAAALLAAMWKNSAKPPARSGSLAFSMIEGVSAASTMPAVRPRS